jgi:hypothetical protein
VARSGDTLEVDGEVDPVPSPTVRDAMLGLASLALFAVGLLVTEAPGELALDVDLKLFFVPYLLIASVRFGIPTLSVGLGAALGEGVLDVFEGYELDDPVGFIGYVLGFTAFGWYLDAADDPERPRTLAVGAVLGAAVQAAFEATAFLIFEPTASRVDATVSLLGNTVTHGVLLGAVPLVLLYPHVRDRIEETFG